LRSTKLITISIIPELLKKVNQLAKEENRTRSELFREALRRYVEEKDWQRLSRYGRLKALDRGLKEGDVERLIEEFRNETNHA